MPLIAVFSTALALIAGGCAHSAGDGGTTAVVLFDLSGSTDHPQVRDAYCDNFRHLLSDLTFGDRVAVAWITESSAMQPTLAVDQQFPGLQHGNALTTNALEERARNAGAADTLKAEREATADSVCAALQHQDRRILRTDIMTSLDLASRIFKREGSATDLVVIMSDMIEDSDRYNFDRLALGPKEVASIIEGERKAGRIPDLSGAYVCVVGAATSDRRTYYPVRRFWEAYFASAGAKLVDYGGPYVGCKPRAQGG